MEKKDVCKECKYYERNAELEPCVSCKNLLSNNFERKQTEDFDYLGLIKKELESGGWVFVNFNKSLIANRDNVEMKFFVAQFRQDSKFGLKKMLVMWVGCDGEHSSIEILLKNPSEEFITYDAYTHKLILDHLNECLVKVQE